MNGKAHSRTLLRSKSKKGRPTPPTLPPSRYLLLGSTSFSVATVLASGAILPSLEIDMSGINRGRLILSGIVAGFVWTILSSLITAYLSREFVSAVPHRRLIAPPSGLVAFLLILNLAMGIWAMWLYAAIRPRFGPGPATAALTGLSWWIITSLVDATWGSFGFVPQHALLAPMIASLPALILAALTGAWLYRE